MDPMKIILKYYKPDSKAYKFLIKHSRDVTEKALDVAKKVKQLHPELDVDMEFIKEAAMMHDIGIFLTNAPNIGCYGKEPYIKHGILGAEILKKEGLPRHALVCERHVGAGLSKEYIEKNNLPLPKKDMIPETVEEKIICFSDKFFSKSPEKIGKEETIGEIRKELAKFSREEVERFDEWLKFFGYGETLLKHFMK